MKQLYKFMSYLVLVMLVLVLSGCGTSLQKPTGLEKDETPAVENAQDEAPEIDEEQNEEVEIGVEASAVDNALEVEQEQAVETEKTVEDPVSDEEKPSKTTPTGKDSAKAEEPTKKPTVSIEKPATNSADKPTVNSTEKPTKKPTENPTENPTEKPAEKPSEKPVDKPESKPDPKPNKPTEKPVTPSTSKIVYSIVISSSEVPLPPTEMEIKDGETVLTALIAITRKHKIQMDYRGGQGATAYVEGMDNVYEFDRGQGSGWMYRVNGIFPDRGAGVVPLQDGDRVEWLYTTNLGEDLNADLKPFRR